MAFVVEAGLRASGAGGSWEGKCKQRKKSWSAFERPSCRNENSIRWEGEVREDVENQPQMVQKWIIRDALLLAWSVMCVTLSLNPTVLSASLLGGSTSDVSGGGHAGICH